MRRFLATVAFLTACGGVSDTAAPATAVILVDGGMTVEHDRLAAGRVVLEIANTGQFGHTVVITTAAGEVVAATHLLAPGETLDWGVDLAPGAYQFSCRIVASGPNGEVFDHYQLGMRADVAVVAG